MIDQERLGFVGYGTYHQCYYLDGKLIAVSVLDILPRYVSSGYFYYDPSLSSLSLGRYSTLREIALVQEIKAIPGFEAMEYYTMGHYVSSAPKTHYKASYHPSYLLDPVCGQKATREFSLFFYDVFCGTKGHRKHRQTTLNKSCHLFNRKLMDGSHLKSASTSCSQSATFHLVLQSFLTHASRAC